MAFAVRKPIDQNYKWILGFISIVILASLYQALSMYQHSINPTDKTIPSFYQLWQGLIQVVTPDSYGHRWLVDDVSSTFFRHATGLGVGVAFSIVIGICMGAFPMVEYLLLPTLSFLTRIPPTAMMSVFFVLIVSTGNPLFITMIAFGVIPTLTQAVYQSAKYDVKDNLIHKAYTLGASNFEVIYNVIFKTIQPRIFESVRLQIGPAMVYLIAAESLVADVGFGYRLRIQGRQLDMNIVYDYIVILGIAGFVMDYALTYIRTKVCPWFESK